MTINPIHRENLMKELARRNGYLRSDGRMFYEGMHCPDYYGNVVIRANVYVEPPNRAKSTRKHRIKVGCPHCGKLIPFGRIAQHFKVH